MSPPLKSLGIDQLSVAQRILLEEEIWDSITVQMADLPLTEAQTQNLHRQITDYENNPKVGSNWAEVKTRLREKS